MYKTAFPGGENVKGVELPDGQQDYSSPASEEMIQLVAARLRERNIEALVVNDGEAAREVVLKRLPKGAEVYSGKSQTLKDAGIFDALQDPLEFNSLRARMFKMDRKTQAQEIRKLIGAPDYMLGSVQAITQDGILVAVSATANQLGPYANTAGKVILVVGSQKIVPDLERAFERIRTYVQPWEEAQLRKAANIGTFAGKWLLIEREWVNGRMTVILVREPIGI